MSFFLHEAHYRDLAPAAERRITICGAGALGANLAETLARIGMRRLRVIDRDRIAPHNLSTQPWLQQDIGAPKVRVLTNMLYRAVGTKLDAHHCTLTAGNAAALLRESDLIIDAFDNLPSRGGLSTVAEQLGLPCLHIALAPGGDYGCGLWDGAYTVRELPTAAGSGPHTCNYPLTRPLAMLVASAAAEVIICFLLTAERRGFELTLRDMRLALV